ncbi:MAG: metal-dependent phosphohydrolase, partial [Calditrichaeota bacterium]
MSPLSNDRQLNRLLKNVIQDVVTFARNRTRQIERLTQIGIALSAEKNINRLLEMIVDEARHITRADAGTLYIVDEEARLLRFTIVQNDSLNIRMGGT